MNWQKGSTYQATLLRSPDRSIGLGDATRRANIATAKTEDDVEEENLPIQPSYTSSVSPSPSLSAPSHLSNRPLPDLNLPPAPLPKLAPPAPLSAKEEQDLLTKREQVKRELQILLRIGYGRRGRNEKTVEKLPLKSIKGDWY
ncbi:unnamed protein product [Ilex paraguariensis]|uniref:Uncharacterized protein n=1 Tax=Ilex paraguariensis TaxID=185542 RepID=A0ABC8TG04_9AQUA